MDKKKLLEAIKKVRENSKKRNFVQSVDMIIALKGVDLKKPEDRVSVVVALPHGKGKKPKVCALVDKSLIVQAKEVFDKAIVKDEFKDIKPKEAKKIVEDYDYFVAQATIMSDIASTFGKYLGPKGKMPDPKLGLIITPKTDLKALKERLGKVLRLRIKKNPVLSGMIGVETMSDEELADNALAVYNAVEKALPRGKQQIGKVYLKTTMGKPVVVE